MEAQWITLLIAIIPLWLLQNVIHELSHGLTLYLGWDWKFKIWPFPSKRLGRFTFAHVKYERVEKSKEPPNCGWALVSIMPRIVNIVLITLLMILTLSIPNKIASMALLVFMWTNLIDFCVGLLSSLKNPNMSDIWKFQQRLGVPVDYLRYSCVGLTIYMGAAVVITTLIELI